MGASRKCACGRRATRERQGSKWVPLPECRRCLAATRIAGVVNGLAGARMRYVEKELELLRQLEGMYRRADWTLIDNRLLSDLDTLRSLQAQREGD